MNVCPLCGSPSLISQDIETIVNAVALPKLDDREQVRCENCEWIGFENPGLVNKATARKSFRKLQNTFI